MKVKNRGMWGYRQDDAGLVSGIWVENIAMAQLDDDDKPNLRMLLSWLSVDSSTGITWEQCEKMYEAVEANKLQVKMEDQTKGGGFWVVREDESEISKRRCTRPWWKFW
ncbi:MAG: hypothetical protein ABFD81_13995 [Syntrophaceae bacterium]